jgi:mannosyltransferase
VNASVPFSRSALTPQRALSALIAITVAGFALRILWAGREPLWTDEALTLIIAKWPVEDLLVRPIDPTPGLYYLLHKWLIPDSAGAAAVRSISIVAGTLSIPAVYAVGRLAISPRAGLLAASLLALSPVLVDYSQEARVYALELLLVLLSAAGLLAWTDRLGRSGGGAGLALFSVATVLAFSAHLVSIFWVIPAVLLAFRTTFRRGTTVQKRLFLVCAVLMALGAVPESQRLLWRASLGGGFAWLVQASPAEALATWGRDLLPLGRFDSQAASIAALIAAFGLAAWRIAVNREEWRSWSREHEVAVGVITIMVVAPVAVWLFGFILVPIFMPRTILITVPGFILLLALVAHLDGKPWLTTALVLLFALSLILTGPVRQKEDWGALAAALKRDVQSGDVIVACPEWKYPALRHALPPPLAVPVVTTLGKDMVIMDRSVDRDQAWIQRYFSIFLEPHMRRLMKQPATLPAHPSATPSFRRAWLVESECAEDQRRSVRSWLGQGHWTLTFVSPATPPHSPPIQLWRFDGAQPSVRQVLAFSG